MSHLPGARHGARVSGAPAGGAAAPADFVLATANPDKAEEVRAILAESLGNAVALAPRPADLAEVEETGDTLEDNARLKARAVSAATGLPAIADDTGLFVDALDGAPGVYSARYAGVHASYSDNVDKLLGALAGVTHSARTARFRTVVIAAFPDGSEIVAEGVVEGRIATEAVGTRGFGYDPVFIPDEGGGRTFAEMEPADKHEISHRGRAVRALAGKLAGRLPADRPREPRPADDQWRAPLAAGTTEIAIGGLVLAVLWIFFFGSVLGLGLGLAARRRLSRSGSPVRGGPPARAQWRIANAAVALGGLGVAVAVVLAGAQAAGLVHIGALCHSTAGVISCRLHVRR